MPDQPATPSDPVVEGVLDDSARELVRDAPRDRGLARPVDRDADQTGLRSLDLVQRLVASALTVVVLGSLVAGLSAFVLLSGPTLTHGRAVGLWVMIGVVGLVTAMAVLVINRRRPWSPWVGLGLLPMAVVAFGLFG